ncbi:type I restriction-modification system subunit M [Helicobacter sp. MIT 05-5293]|uniref:type I restriction-modification system subunit M n=1 Tax=Helicobacter sp. MIT 05-5293 TaxID=1548149 RepID=UPI00051D152E|nr:type I restriction-modification system subunit M [Helicobacter sp. MIT 05-5293]TLD80870.1 type I restriction-modification system subunit M [Helicobacter sp. MIT 05-5293]
MKSTGQKEELFKTLWKIANELRNKVDGWDFKNYVLGFLFYYFISENLKSHIQEAYGQDYEALSDEEAANGREEIIKRKGFFIPPSALFSNVLKNADLENLNQNLTKIFKDIEESSRNHSSFKQFEGLFSDVDLYSNKLNTSKDSKSNVERNKRILKIMQSIADSGLDYKESEIDIFGDAYEYLIGMYASSAGKSGGEFFTPQEVGRLLAELTLCNNIKPNKVYDPACGSGSLLLQYKRILQQDPKQGYFGQEINPTSYNLARMNMLLHNVNYTHFDIAFGDTLIAPNDDHKAAEPFDAIVSNPPFSTKWEGKSNALLINDERFARAGVLAPESNADFAFVMHSLAWLSEKGSAAIVCFPGIMYRSGAERDIRKYLIEGNFVDCVMALAPNMFFGKVTIAVNILVLRKNKSDDKVLFINAGEEFVKVGTKNKLAPKHIARIIESYKARGDEQYFSALIPKEQIANNDYNLSVSSYVETKDTREKIDITALNAEIGQIVARQSALRVQIEAIVTELEA